MRKFTLVLTYLLLLVDQVMAHTEEAGPTFGLIQFLFVILGVSIVVGAGLLFIRKFETTPGTFPMKKLTIAAVATIIVNALLLGFVYREVLF